MKERPIIFTTESVKAILDGRKTQTRRVINKPQPVSLGHDKMLCWGGIDGNEYFLKDWANNQHIFPKCHYGQAGDKNFTYFIHSAPPCDGYYEVIWDEGDKPQFVYLKRYEQPDLGTIPTKHEWEHWLWGKDEHDDPEAMSLDIRQPELIQWRRAGDRLWVRETFYTDNHRQSNGLRILYKADGDTSSWKSSIFMPRWASRIDLEITEVRVERVQEITEADAIAEGAVAYYGSDTAWGHFSVIWDSINAKRGYGWETNPWVWVISFRKID